MSELIIKTPESHPDHPVVGHYYAGTCWSSMTTAVYRCTSYDSRVDYYMTNVCDPEDVHAVSVRAIDRTFHEAEDRGDYWFVGRWGKRLPKEELQAVADQQKLARDQKKELGTPA